MSADKIFKGRAGKTYNLRQFHLYMFSPDKAKSVNHQGHMLVSYSKEYADKRGSVNGKSKSMTVFDYIKENKDRAFYSKELVEALKDKGVKPCDIMTNVRRFEKAGQVYVRGYRMHDKQTPFKDGYLLTWIDSGKPRELAIEEAICKTNTVLDSKSSTSLIIERFLLQLRYDVLPFALYVDYAQVNSLILSVYRQVHGCPRFSCTRDPIECKVETKVFQWKAKKTIIFYCA